MVKKRYKSPILMELETEEDPAISFGGSQGTSGYDSQWTWDSSLDDLIGMYDDTDLAAMDKDHDYFISIEEFDSYEP